MAEWGIAMSRWGNPFNLAQRAAGPLEEGQAAVDGPRPSKPTTPREQAYVDAVATLFAKADTVDQRTRIVAYRDAMAAVAAANPADVEAQVFYALSIAGSHTPSDKTYANLLKAARDPREGSSRRHPHHPGLAHYIIHSYDVPALADRALVAARRYATIAPSRRTRSTCRRTPSRASGRGRNRSTPTSPRRSRPRRTARSPRSCTRWTTRPTPSCRPGRTPRRGRMLAELPEIKARFDPEAIGGAAPGSAGLFALASMPARYALERGDWKASGGAHAGAEPLPLPRGADLVRQGRSARPAAAMPRRPRRRSTS